MPADAMPADAAPIFDLLIVGGGINGAGIARDATGRGLSVLLCEQGDIGGATSSASSKLIHGGLRYLEHYQFRLVAEALAERETLLRIAPHLCRPLRFVMPHSAALRPAWMIRAGLLLYDTLGRLHGHVSLPGAQTLDLAGDPRGAPLKPEFRRGFAYSDVAADDARLTLANARAASAAGATILPRTRFVAARRADGFWLASLEDGRGRRDVRARAVINAAGPWVARVLDMLPASAGHPPARLVRGSHIVVPGLYEGGHAYTLQNDDRRICFLIPFQRRYTLIGTTELGVADPDQAGAISATETDYLCRAANRYLRRAVQPADVVWSYTGVRPLLDDGHADAADVSREYQFVLDTGNGGRLPALSVFGGKLTTYRTLAEKALRRLAPWFRHMRGDWTAQAPLPGGDLGGLSWPEYVAALCARHPALPAQWLAELAARHGSACEELLDGVRGPDELGRHFGGGLHEREVDYCVAREWARDAEDLLWRRSKAGVRMSATEREAFTCWFETRPR